MLPLRISINGSVIDIYQIINEEQRIVKYIGYSNIREFSSTLQLICVNPSNGIDFSGDLEEWSRFVDTTDWTAAKKFSSKTTKGFFENLGNSMLSRNSQFITKEPSLFGKGSSYSLFSLSNISSGEFTAWSEFLERLDFPDLFQAWVWTLFTDVNLRQALWLQGEGLDGKSVVTNVLSNYLGHLSIALESDAISKGNRFGLQNISGKRLLTFADNKNPNIIQSERMQRLLGADNITVEKRNVGNINVHNNFRILITSNMSPELSSQANDQTRLLLIKVLRGPDFTKSTDLPWGERLKNELPAFLYDCKLKFEGTNYNEDKAGFALPKHYEAISSPMQDLIDGFISSHIEEDRDGIIQAKDLSRDFKNYCENYKEKIDRREVSQLIRTIKQRFGMEPKTVRTSEVVVKGYKGLSLSNSGIYTSLVYQQSGLN
jgi:hypothetical protein